MNRRKFIWIVFVAIWLFLLYMAFFAPSQAEAKGNYQVNRCQVVLEQIATSHEVGEGDTFNNPHPGCVKPALVQPAAEQIHEKSSNEVVPTDAPVNTPINTPEPVDPTQPAPTETVVHSTPVPEVTTEPTATEAPVIHPNAGRGNGSEIVNGVDVDPGNSTKNNGGD
jgi:hypothetical protein